MNANVSKKQNCYLKLEEIRTDLSTKEKALVAGSVLPDQVLIYYGECAENSSKITDLVDCIQKDLNSEELMNASGSSSTNNIFAERIILNEIESELLKLNIKVSRLVCDRLQQKANSSVAASANHANSSQQIQLQVRC